MDDGDQTQVAARAALERVRAARRDAQAAEVRESIALAELAETYRVGRDDVVAVLAEKHIHPAGDGTPGVSEFLSLELGAALGLSQRTALGLVVDVLNLKYRTPRLWAAYCQGLIPRWQAATLAEETSPLGPDRAAWVDARLAVRVGRVSFGRLRRLAKGLVAQADPRLLATAEERTRNARGVHVGHPDCGSADVYATLAARDAAQLDKTLADLAAAMGQAGDDRSLDQRRASALGVLADPALALSWLTDAPLPSRRRGRTVVHLHLAADTVVDPASGVARIEGFGPLTTASLPEFLAGTSVTVRPVVDDFHTEPVDSYEIPERLREVVYREHPVEVFPFSSRTSRSLDLDHVRPYLRGRDWTPDQTGKDNLAPVSRLVHRAKTAEVWKVRRTQYGHFAWRSPLGYTYTVAPDGTAGPSVPSTTRLRR